MIKQSKFIITELKRLTHRTVLMKLNGDTSAIGGPGEFVNLRIQNCYLNRPMSVCDYDEQSLTIMFDIVGKGTALLNEMNIGDDLEVMSGLGIGFDYKRSINRPLLLGGGIGCAPMINLAKKLVSEGHKPVIVLGFNSEADVINNEIFNIHDTEVHIATADGSVGFKGFVTQCAEQNEFFGCDYFYACGPMHMLKACCELDINGEVSLDARMGCGFGACMCCSVHTVDGPRRICVEGPVFDKKVLIWK